MDIETRVRDLERRLELTEMRLSQHAGQFEFISGQLRDIQLYLHAKFADLDQRLGVTDERLNSMEDSLRREIQAIPRAVAEILSDRDR